MPGEWVYWSATQVPPFIIVMAATHLTMSFIQTLMHYRLGHRPMGGFLFRNHITFHHAYYAKGHLATSVSEGNEGNNTPYFVCPLLLVGSTLFFMLPTGLFIAMTLASVASFYAHVWFDEAYHLKGSWLERFAWFRRKRQQHFVHHLHANRNFAVIDFFWDVALGTYQEPDQTLE
jgi:hypothetical protein